MYVHNCLTCFSLKKATRENTFNGLNAIITQEGLDWNCVAYGIVNTIVKICGQSIVPNEIKKKIKLCAVRDSLQLTIVNC